MSDQKHTEAIVRAAGLAAGYRQHVLWQDADFTIRRGEFVGLLGPNGSGKTTLFRLILGLGQQLAGTLEVFGRAPRRGNPRIGYVPQRRHIDDDTHIAVFELVRLGLCGNRWGFDLPHTAQHETQAALAALAKVDAGNLAYRSLGELSGGELQRVFLAQALIGNPDLLLLDEPLANLDIRRERELVETVAATARAEGIAVLLIAHDINPLLPVVDNLIYIVNGKVATGSPQRIITAEKLSALYGAPVEVLRDSRGRVAVLGTEEAVHHE